jgi:hypothetical protein
MDFGIVKRITINSLHVESSFDLSSDHSSVIITMNSKIIPKTSVQTLSTKKTGRNLEIIFGKILPKMYS